MMKYLIICITLFNLTNALADLTDCLKDAKTHGNHWHAISPSIECAGIIKSHPDAIKVETADKRTHIFGLGHMFYVQTGSKLEIMAGDQTELKNISKIEINEKKRRIIVLQEAGVLTFDLDFVGNVTPLRHFKSPLLKATSRVKLMDDRDELAILSKDSKAIFFINANADSRYSGKEFIPKLIKRIQGPKTLLNIPLDFAVSNEKKEIYILDSERVLVFSIDRSGDISPLQIIDGENLKGVHSLSIRNGKLFFFKDAE